MKAPINAQWAEALGLTIFDSLWQGALVLIISFGLLLALRKASPAKRYSVVLVAILILPILSVGTFFKHLDSPAQSTVQNQITWEAPLAFNFELNETLAGTTESIIPLSPLAKWRVWTSENATWALLIWLTGAVFFTVRMLGGFYFLNRLKSKAELIVEPLWLDKLSILCENLKIKGKVILKQSERISSPLVMGIIKPVIIFPMGLIQALPTDEVEAILVHELAHIKRKDFLINIVINLLQVVYFFHPAFWWLKSQLDAEREFHCDDITLGHLGEKLTLIRALTNASEYQGQKFQPALAFAGKKSQLLNRVKRIIYHKHQRNWLSGFLSLGILVLSFLLMSYSTSKDQIDLKQELTEDQQGFTSSTFDLGHLSNNDKEMLFTSAALDTGEVSAAILEILKPNSQIEIITKGNSEVTILQIKKNGKVLTDKEFDAYSKAYSVIKDFATNAESFRLPTEEEWRKASLQKGISELNQQLQTETNELIRRSNESLDAKKADKMTTEELKKRSAQIQSLQNDLSEVNAKLESQLSLKNKPAFEVKSIRQDSLVARVRSVQGGVISKVRLVGSLNNQDNIAYQVNGKIMDSQFSINQLGAIDIQSISVNKNKPQLAAMGLDTVKVEGLINISTFSDFQFDSNSNQFNESKQGELTIRTKKEVVGSSQLGHVGSFDDNKQNVAIEVDDIAVLGKLEDITMQDVESISVIKKKIELHKLNYDTTLVDGLIRIKTKQYVNKSKSEKTVFLRNPSPDSKQQKDTRTVYYAFDGKLISRDEVNKLDDSKIIYADVLKNKTQILSLFPEIQANNPELIRFLNSQDVENYGNELIKMFPYYTSDLDFSTMNFVDAMSNSVRTGFVIATIREDNAIIEIDGELRPNMTEEEIKELDLMSIKPLEIIKNDKMFDYHKNRKLKGYDALIRIITK